MSDVNEKSMEDTLIKEDQAQPKAPGRPRGRPKKEVVKTRTITIDDTPTEVLSLNQTGYDLHFEDDPDRFLELPLGAVQDLSPRNREDYAMAFFYARKQAEERLNPPSGIKVTPGYAPARQQLKVEGGRKGLHYTWARPDQLNRRKQEGFKVVNDPSVGTFNSTVGSTKTLGDMRTGEPEQILLEIPQETYDAHQQALADKAVGKSRDIDGATQAALERMGGKLPENFGAGANTPLRKEVIRTKVR